MPRFNADPERSQLGFTRSARNAFRFLEDDFGFRLVAVEEPTFLRYESPTAFVNVFHSRGGYRIGAEIGRFVTTRQGTRTEDLVTLFEIVNAECDQEAANRLGVPAESAAAVSVAVQDVARLLELYGRGLLLGDDRAYSAIAEYRDAANERHAAHGAQLWEMRRAAHEAWKRGDRLEAIRLLRQIPGLTEDEKQMLGLGDDGTLGRSPGTR